MGKVHYKFIYNTEIDFPESIEFDGIKADIDSDNDDNYTIEGDVDGVALDDQSQLPVFVSGSGRTGRSWELEVTFNTKKLKKYPISGIVEENGFYTLNEKYKLQA